MYQESYTLNNWLRYLGFIVVAVVSKLCLTLLQPMGCSPPGSYVHELSQARILEWISISCCRGSSGPRDQTCISCIGRLIPYHWAPKETRTSLFLCSIDLFHRTYTVYFTNAGIVITTGQALFSNTNSVCLKPDSIPGLKWARLPPLIADGTQESDPSRCAGLSGLPPVSAPPLVPLTSTPVPVQKDLSGKLSWNSFPCQILPCSCWLDREPWKGHAGWSSHYLTRLALGRQAVWSHLTVSGPHLASGAALG